MRARACSSSPASGKAFSCGGDLGMLARDAGVERRRRGAEHGRARRATSTRATCRSATLPDPDDRRDQRPRHRRRPVHRPRLRPAHRRRRREDGHDLHQARHPPRHGRHLLPAAPASAPRAPASCSSPAASSTPPEAERLGIVTRVVAARGVRRRRARPRRARSPSSGRSPCAW